jgi:hypothetical protein
VRVRRPWPQAKTTYFPLKRATALGTKLLRASRAAPEARLLRGKSALARAPPLIEAAARRTCTPDELNEDARRTFESVAVDLTRSLAKLRASDSSLSFIS